MNKILDIIILVLIIIYSVGYFIIHYEQFGLQRQPFVIPIEIEKRLDVLLVAIFSLMFVDVYLKYRKIRNWKIFLKRHWLDILMLVLIPIFSVFKVINFSIKFIKTLKMTKSGFKIVHLTKKIFKISGKKK